MSRRAKNNWRKCKKCCNALPLGEFEITGRGNLRRECKACYKPPPQIAVCLKCARALPLSEFGSRLTIVGKVRRQMRCKECFRTYASSAKCMGCKEMLAREAFPRHVNGHYSDMCSPCHEARLHARANRKCVSCKEVKRKTDFCMLLGGAYSTRCVPCTLNAPPGRPKLYKLDQKCLACGTDMWTSRPPETMRDVEFCRIACKKRGKAKEAQNCIDCGVRVEKKDFPVYLTRENRPNFRCKDCVRAGSHGENVLARSNYSLRKVRWNLVRLAEKRGDKCDITVGKLRELIPCPCAICGGIMETVALHSERSPVTMASLRPICSYCLSCKGKRDLDEILGWARRIADHHGLGRPQPPIRALRKVNKEKQPHAGAALIREFSRANDPKRNTKRNSSLIPPQIFEDSVIDETFEQRLARHARVRQSEANEEN